MNHLYRSKADRRHAQARMLNEWVEDQNIPLIAVGDYNFDWDVDDGELDHDLGYDHMTADDAFVWVRPEILRKTQLSPRYNSVLDSVFVNDEGRPWAPDSTILHEGFPSTDDETTADHLPVLARFDTTTNSSHNLGSIQQQLLDRVERLEDELAELRLLIEQLGQ